MDGVGQELLHARIHHRRRSSSARWRVHLCFPMLYIPMNVFPAASATKEKKTSDSHRKGSS